MNCGMESPHIKILRFQEWFSENGGVIHEGAYNEWNEDCQYNLQVGSGHTIRDDSIVISCPTSLAFCFMTYAHKDQAGYRSKIDRTSLNQDVVLRLTLMEQYSLGIKSFWWPYITILPQPHLPPVSHKSGNEGEVSTVEKQSFHTPLYFDEEDMLWLKGTNLGAAAKSRVNEWREEFENAKNSIKGLDEMQQALWTRFAPLR